MTNQLVELLSNPKYGNKERITEIWYDGAKFGSGLKTQVYYYEKWLYYIEALEPGCLVNSRYESGVRILGNEAGNSGYPNWQRTNLTNERWFT